MTSPAMIFPMTVLDPKRNDQPDEDGYPLEHTGVGAGQIRVDHRDHKRVQQETYDIERRLRPVRIETGDLEFSLSISLAIY